MLFQPGVSALGIGELEKAPSSFFVFKNGKSPLDKKIFNGIMKYYS
jgi:hypothetical protein